MNKVFNILCFMLICSVVTSCTLFKNKKQHYIQSAYLELKDSFQDANVTLLSDSIKLIFPDNIMFNIGQSEILEHFLVKLQRLTKIFNKYEKTNLLITGHTDNTGEEELNLKLSEERARKVKNRMIENGTDSERIFTWGIGQNLPLTTNDTAEGRTKNRRVEFVILYNSK